MTRPVPERLQEAAFALFAERGYDATSVDDIAERAGVGRTTFFRAFASKEAVIFPDHPEVVRRIRERLEVAGERDRFSAIADAARIVLLHYLREGDVARTRYGLTRTVPALRDREQAAMRQYRGAFVDFARQWMEGPHADLHAELLSGAVVGAHNHVLRRWLRGETEDALAEFDTAMIEVEGIFWRPESEAGAIVVVTTPGAPDKVAEAVRRALATSSGLAGGPAS